MSQTIRYLYQKNQRIYKAVAWDIEPAIVAEKAQSQPISLLKSSLPCPELKRKEESQVCS